jgi:hypothetical protein
LLTLVKNTGSGFTAEFNYNKDGGSRNTYFYMTIGNGGGSKSAGILFIDSGVIKENYRFVGDVPITIENGKIKFSLYNN